MGRFSNNTHFIQIFVRNMVKIPTADLNSTMITYRGVQIGTEERDNRS